MRPLFRRDPWRQRPVLNREVGVADIVLVAAVITILAVVAGLNSVEVGEILELFKSLRESLTVL